MEGLLGLGLEGGCHRLDLGNLSGAFPPSPLGTVVLVVAGRLVGRLIRLRCLSGGGPLPLSYLAPPLSFRQHVRRIYFLFINKVAAGPPTTVRLL